MRYVNLYYAARELLNVIPATYEPQNKHYNRIKYTNSIFLIKIQNNKLKLKNILASYYLICMLNNICYKYNHNIYIKLIIY